MAKSAKTNPFAIPATAVEAGAIFMIAPWVFAARMAGLAGSTPFGAAMELQRFGNEKSVAAFHAGVDAALAVSRLAAHSAAGTPLGLAKAADSIASAALKPVASRVKANAIRRK